MIIQKWKPHVEARLECPTRIDDALTVEYEWGWTFSVVPVHPDQCPMLYNPRQFAIDRVTGYAYPVGGFRLQGAVNYLMKWRKVREDEARAAAGEP